MTVETVRLGDVADYIRGITFKPADVVPAHSPDSVVCMTTKNVQATLDESKLTAVPPRFVKRDEQYLQCGDILISSANSWNLVGKATFVPKLSYTATAGGFISILRAQDEKVDPRYLYNWVSSGATQHRARLCARQTTNIANLDRGRFLGLKIPLPPLPEQRRIAAILDIADAVRRKRQQTLDLADQFLRSTFLDMFGDPVTNPKRWPVVRLSDLVAGPVRNGLSPSRSGTHAGEVLTLSAITGSQFEPEARKTALFDVEPPPEKMVDGRDFLVCRGNGNIDLVGKAAFPPESMPGVLFPDTMIGFRLDMDRVAKAYLQMVWKSGAVRGQIVAKARTTSGIHKVNQQTLKSTTFPLPPIGEQLRFAELADRVRELQVLINTGLGSALLGSLTQRAFRGDT